MFALEAYRAWAVFDSLTWRLTWLSLYNHRDVYLPKIQSKKQKITPTHQEISISWIIHVFNFHGWCWEISKLLFFTCKCFNLSQKLICYVTNSSFVEKYKSKQSPTKSTFNPVFIIYPIDYWMCLNEQWDRWIVNIYEQLISEVLFFHIMP